MEIPYLAAQALIFSPISYWIVQFRMEAGELEAAHIVATRSLAAGCGLRATALGGLCWASSPSLQSSGIPSGT